MLWHTSPGGTLSVGDFEAEATIDVWVNYITKKG